MTRLEQKLHLIYGGKNHHIFIFIITPTELGRSDYHSCDNCSAVGPHGSLISWDGYYYEVNFPGTAATLPDLYMPIGKGRGDLEVGNQLGLPVRGQSLPDQDGRQVALAVQSSHG